MTRLVFVRSGKNKMTIKELPDADARQAEKDGWGQIVNDPKTDARAYSVSIDADHMQKADAYFDRQQQGYANREMTTQPSPAVRSSPLGEPDGGEDATVASPLTGKASPPKGKKTARTK